jgi:hypothetical protein
MGKVRGIPRNDAFGPFAPGEGGMERITRERSSLVVTDYVHGFLDWGGRHLARPHLELSAFYDLARIGLDFQDHAPGRGADFELLPPRYARSPTQIMGKHDSVRAIQSYGSSHAVTMAHLWHESKPAEQLCVEPAWPECVEKGTGG